MTRVSAACTILLAALAAALDSRAGHSGLAIVAGVVVIALPGIVLGGVLGRSLDLTSLERWVFALASSVAVCVLGAFLLNAAGGLTRTTWLALLTVTTVLGCLVALAQARTSPLVGDDLHSRSPGLLAALSGLTPRGVAGIVLAVAVAGGAVGLSVVSSAAAPGFSALWVVPHVARGAAAGYAQLGVTSDQRRRARFRLVVTVDGRPVRRSVFDLSPHDSRSERIRVTATESLTAQLDRAAGGRWQLYREVHCVPATASLGAALSVDGY